MSISSEILSQKIDEYTNVFTSSVTNYLDMQQCLAFLVPFQFCRFGHF